MSYKDEFSWSSKRDKVFCTCKRKYYYECYGYKNGWFKESSKENQDVWRLKKLKTIPQFVGELVGNQIKEFLLELKKGNEPKSDVILKNMEEGFKSKFEQSKKLLFQKNPKDFLGLREHEYALLLDDAFVKEKLELAKSCMVNFLKSDVLNEIKYAPVETWIFPEKYESRGFPSFYFENTLIYSVFKFGIFKNGTLVLYDWTTALEEDLESDLDVKNSVFLIFFSKKENLMPNQIKVKKMYLRTGVVDTNEFTNSAAARIKNHLRESISEIKSLLDDKEKNKAIKENFEKTDNESNCTYCSYKKLCAPLSISEFTGYGD